MSGVRLAVGAVFMGVILPITLFFLLGLHTFSQFFTIAASTFLTWGVADLFSNLVERPRLKGRSPAAAIREDVERRAE